MNEHNHEFCNRIIKKLKKFNAIFMIVNRLTKMHHYVSCVAEEDETTIEETTRLLINHV
jgi:hypothetical protein